MNIPVTWSLAGACWRPHVAFPGRVRSGRTPSFRFQLGFQTCSLRLSTMDRGCHDPLPPGTFQEVQGPSPDVEMLSCLSKYCEVQGCNLMRGAPKRVPCFLETTPCGSVRKIRASKSTSVLYYRFYEDPQKMTLLESPKPYCKSTYAPT